MDELQKKISNIFVVASMLLAVIFAMGAFYLKSYENAPTAQDDFSSPHSGFLADMSAIFHLGQATTNNTPSSTILADPDIFSGLAVSTSTDISIPALQNVVFPPTTRATVSSSVQSSSIKTIPIPQVPPVLQGTPSAPQATIIQNLGSASVLANWTVGANSTITADTSLYTEGTQSLSLITDGEGDPAVAKVLSQGPYDLTNQYLEIWIRVSATTNINDLWFTASSDNLKANSYKWELDRQIEDTPDDSEIQAGEWVPIVLTFDSDGTDMVTTGAPNVAALNSFELHISDNKQGPLTVWLGGISAVAEPPQGVLSIVLDNGWLSEYTLAMPTLAKYNFPAVIAEIPETANAPAFMSTQQLQYLQNELGWDIACHTWNHTYQLGLPNTTIATMDSQFTKCKDWLMENGLGKASNILVWPNGSNSPAAIAEASKYFVTARGIVGTMFNTLPPANPMLLYATEFGGTTPTSTLDADVDRCMANHEWCIFYGHIITTSTPLNQDQYASSSFDDFVAHIAADGIPVKTITQVLENEPYSAPSTSISNVSNLETPQIPPLDIPVSTSNLSMPYVQSNFTDLDNWAGTWGDFSGSPASLDIGANASTTGASAILEKSGDWADYTFNTVFDWVKGQTVSLVARYTDHNNYVTCELNASIPGSIIIELEQYMDGVRYNLATGEAFNDSGVGDSNINAYIKVHGEVETCSFNNHVVSNNGNGYLLNPPYSGSIGFDIWDPTINNSQIVVKKIDVEDNH